MTVGPFRNRRGLGKERKRNCRTVFHGKHGRKRFLETAALLPKCDYQSSHFSLRPLRDLRQPPANSRVPPLKSYIFSFIHFRLPFKNRAPPVCLP
ncbi:hypothetical protein SAY87_007183 [Trapa incisa]|uniref:Uncharacterized protein n=1 Tax=Trapa incisa TaxID=236973 RepID=A0AAN7K0Y1_9MYRT|nr:hypothetical protein SAY87_007183 [Trapa incisa]